MRLAPNRLLAAEESNQRYAELLEKRRVEDDRERQRLEQHKASIANAADRIRFDR